MYNNSYGPKVWTIMTDSYMFRQVSGRYNSFFREKFAEVAWFSFEPCTKYRLWSNSLIKLHDTQPPKKYIGAWKIHLKGSGVHDMLCFVSSRGKFDSSVLYIYHVQYGDMDARLSIQKRATLIVPAKEENPIITASNITGLRAYANFQVIHQNRRRCCRWGRVLGKILISDYA